MKIYFWQYRPSMHQNALVNALKNKCELTWIVEKNDLSAERKSMGWDEGYLVPDIQLKDFEEMLDFLKKNENACIHLFSGTRASKNLRQIYLHLINIEATVYYQSEASNYFGLTGILRIIRGHWEARRERGKVAGVFAIGSLGLKYFKLIGYNKKQIFPFGYFVDTNQISPSQKDLSSKDTVFNIIFVGRLIKTKGVHLLLRSLRSIEGRWDLVIIGNGPEEKFLKDYVMNDDLLNEKVRFKDFMENSQIFEFLKKSDLLVLPSIKKDGWGVVVNESLMVGTPVIVSDKCGSSILIQDFTKGEVVKAGSLNSLFDAINKRINTGKINIDKRERLKKWSELSITGNTAAEYMLKCIEGETIKSPWSK